MRWLWAGALAGLVVVGFAGPGAGTAAAQTVHVVGGGCDNCHKLHGPAGARLTDFATTELLCLSCHTDGANPSAPSGISTHLSPKYEANDSAATCRACHTPHRGDAGTNLALIRPTITTPISGGRTVVFASRGTDAVAGTPPSQLPGPGLAANSFADGDATYNGVCEVCHTKTSNHQNGTVLPDNSNHGHNAGKQCTQCHAHDAGFQGLGGRCADCHNTAKGSRRPTTPEFERSSHHLNLAGLGVATAQDIEDATCQVCHAEDVGNGTMGDGNLQFNDQAGGTITLTADPHTNRAAAVQLNALCLGCHKDSPPTNPFGDGQNPPARNVAAWNASSHRTSFGGMGCIDCHSSGHGSQKVRLLGNEIDLSAGGGFQSPSAYGPAVAPASTFLNEEQEGFCLNCHKAGGPSQYNIAAGFSQPIRWVPGVTGITSNPDFNDRHDIQQDAQTRSGVAGFECTTCHNPHTATSTQPFVSNPDPTDGRTPGVGSLWNTTINGVNYQNSLVTAFCLDCHDNSFPAGLTGAGAVGHTIANIDSTWRYLYTARKDESKNDRMGVFNSAGGEGINDPILLWNGSQYSSIARPWVTGMVFNCEQCHSPHPGAKRNLFSLKDEVQHNGQTVVWTNGGADTVRNYSVTSWSVTDGVNNSGFFCNSCHDRDGMNSKGYCYDGCHIHGGSPGL